MKTQIGVQALGLTLMSVVLGQTGVAQAEELGISFELSPPSIADPTIQTHAEAPDQSPALQATPLALPIAAREPVASAPITTLPPPPLSQPPVALAHSASNSAESAPDSVAVSFSLPIEQEAASESPQLVAVLPAREQDQIAPVDNQAPADAAFSDRTLFAGNSNSLVAKAVGSAEGTRTANGERTRAYYGHVDPGNGVWNLGSFSYQHGASSPEAADAKQLRRLQTQLATLNAQAVAKGLTLTLEETLNGIDLANQSPRAALSRGGYIDRLHQAYDMGLQGSEAILWARTRAFLDPDTDRWNAPGLGNNVHSITHDQERRQRAIERAIVAHRSQEIENSPDPAVASD